MRSPEAVMRVLRERGDLWEPAPGLIGLRGDTLRLRDAVHAELARVSAELAAEEWRVPAALPLETLARAEYFASFPQWLTLASHLPGDAAALEAVARAADPAAAARAAAAPAAAALPPAACYHVYAALADRTLHAPIRVRVECTCWRHEGARLRPLGRGWAFTMREAVCVARAEEVAAFRAAGIELARAAAARLGLAVRIAQAQDPFFAPTARGKALLQSLKALKHEMLVDVPGAAPLAIASFNHHERFFGAAFGIRLAGAAAASGCVAFGVERWLLAFLLAHGADPRDWGDFAAGAPRQRRPMERVA